MLPILYSFRRCPYAIRSRLAIRAAGRAVILREVALKSKPEAMLQLSPKGTVPVLCLPDGVVLEQSLDVMLWALGDEWCSSEARALIAQNDGAFKSALDKYKYAVRFPEHSIETYRAQGEVFLNQLDQVLQTQSHLAGDVKTPLDWAIFPFVRQFAGVDSAWFEASPYVALRRWLNNEVESALFKSVMQAYQPWQEGQDDVVF